MGNCKVATTNIRGGFDKEENVDHLIQMAEEAAKNGAKLVVFAEQYIQGYFPKLTGPLTTEIVRHHQKEAEIIPEGESVQKIINCAQKNDIYIAFGMTERDKNFYDVLYNTAVLVGPEGYIGNYRKVHQPVDEKHIYTRGDDFPVFNTKIGKIGMAICLDKYMVESARELTLRGAEMICFLTAWENYLGDEPEKEGYMLADKFDVLDVARAMENQVWVITANLVGKIGESNYCGNAKIVNPDGFILANCGNQEEGIVYADIDVEEEIMKVRSEVLVTMIHERNPAAYKASRAESGYPRLAPLSANQNTDLTEP